MEFTLHKDLSDIPAAAWNDLASAGISDTPFARHEYLSLWWKTRGGGEWTEANLTLITASEAGHLVGIAPLFESEHDGRRTLLLVGSIEISDYLDLIVRKNDVDGFVKGLLDFIGASPGLRGLPLDWYNVSESSPTLSALQAEAERRGAEYVVEVFRPTPQIALEGSFEAYLSGLDKKQRHEIRRKMRRAADGPTPARFELLRDPTHLDESIEAFLELMKHDTDKQRFLSPAMAQHMRQFMRLAWELGYLWLAFLSVGGKWAAAALNFDYGNRLWGYNSAISRDFMELSPGWVLLGHQLQWACDNGRSAFDFMRGHESYKYRFGAVDRHVMRARLIPA